MDYCEQKLTRYLNYFVLLKWDFMRNGQTPFPAGNAKSILEFIRIWVITAQIWGVVGNAMRGQKSEAQKSLASDERILFSLVNSHLNYKKTRDCA